MSEFKTTERDITASVATVSQTVTGITITFKEGGSFSFVPQARHESTRLELEVTKAHLGVATAKLNGVREIVRLIDTKNG